MWSHARGRPDEVVAAVALALRPDRLLLVTFTAFYGLAVALYVTSQWMY
jgi:hypothetical protein